MIFDSKLYDVLKWIQRVVLPGIATLYMALSNQWVGIFDLPYPKQVCGTIFAVTFFLGSLLGVSQVKYDHMMQIGLPDDEEEL